MTTNWAEEIEKRKEILRNRKEGGLSGRFRPREYAIPIDWKFRPIGTVTELPCPIIPPGGTLQNATPNEQLVGTVQVDPGTIFYVDGVDFSLSLVATLAGDPPVGAEFTTNASSRFSVSGFGFKWNVRDTGSNRDWSNRPLDETDLMSGFECGLKFKDAVGVVSGGSTVIVTLTPTYAYNNQEFSGLSAIDIARFRFSFVGESRRLT